MRKLIKFTDQNLQTHYNETVQQYTIGEWVKPSDGKEPQRGESCGKGSLHLMKWMRPKYAPYPYLAHEAIGRGELGEDDEKVRFREVKLIRTLSDQEINQAMDDDWASRLGKAGLFLPISWVRTATFLDRPVDTIECSRLLQPTLDLIGCIDLIGYSKPIKYLLAASSAASLWNSLWDSLRDLLGESFWDSLGDSLRDSFGTLLRNSLGTSLWDSLGTSLKDSLGNSFWNSLRNSLRNSLWKSLWFKIGFEMTGKPKQELADLLSVWQMGACPVGETDDSFLVLIGK